MLRYKASSLGSLLAVAATFAPTNKDLFEVILDTIKGKLPEEVPTIVLVVQWYVMDHI